MTRVPFSPPDITQAEIDSVTEVLKSGWITTGPKTKQFESRIAEYCRTNRAVCLNSATACMEMTLNLLGIGEGDEVITSAYTYTASASVVCHVGARPVLVDTAPGSYEMDYDKLEQAITEKTKAIIPVDIAGVMCDYDRIFNIVEKKRNLFMPENDLQRAIGRVAVIADSAHCFGASRNGVMSGSAADFTSFSFHAVKNLTTAEGGAITWKQIQEIDDEWIYKQLMLLSLHGQNKDALAKEKLGAWEYDIVITGYKCNMTDIMAAIGLAQLDRYEGILAKRRKYIEMYDKGFENVQVTPLVHYTDTVRSSGHLYLLRLDGKDVEFRNDLIVKLAERGICTNVHYKPLPMHTAYKKLGFDIKDFPNAYDMYRNEITLPLNTVMTEDDVKYVINELNALLEA